MGNSSTENSQEGFKNVKVSSSSTGQSNRNKRKRDDNINHKPQYHPIDLQEKLLHEFQHTRKFSIRISASNIAAMAGLHPWKNLPELILMDLVYQGRYGRMLLENDASLLGVALVNEDTQLRDLASKARSNDVRDIVQQAINVKSGVDVLLTIQNTNEVKDKLLRNIAATALNDNERRLLLRGVQHAVDTGYGIAHEKDGLDLYEKQIGCTVYQRNAEICIWPFGLVENETNNNKRVNEIPNSPSLDYPIATPLLPYAVPWSKSQQEPTTDNECILSSSTTTVNDIQLIARNSKTVDDISDQEASMNFEKNDSSQGHNSEPMPTSKQLNEDDINFQKPFFSIVGSIDGIRDEIVFGSASGLSDAIPETNTEEFDSIYSKQVIVECKHRMNRIQSIPPLYEQIQCVVYCLMYNVKDADLVQVLRTTTPAQAPLATISDENSSDSSEKSARTIDFYFQASSKSSIVDDNIETTSHSTIVAEQPVESYETELGWCNVKLVSSVETKPIIEIDVEDVIKANENNIQNKLVMNQPNHAVVTIDDDKDSETKEITKQQDIPTHSSEISVCRVSLDDPVYQHHTNWYNVILPRLTSFVQAAYTIRSDDDKRYRLLAAVAKASTTGDVSMTKVAYDILFLECPWLQSCDTSYNRVQ